MAPTEASGGHGCHGERDNSDGRPGRTVAGQGELAEAGTGRTSGERRRGRGLGALEGLGTGLASGGLPARTIFADGTGKNAQWMWLKALTVFDNKFCWGSAALAYLYRQLDEACRRFTKDGGIGGCMLLLSPHPPEWVDTDTQLHRLDRRRQRKIKDWNKHHKKYVIMFEQSVEAARSTQGTQPREHCPLALNNYARWFQDSTRVEICPPAYEEEILEEPTEYDALAHVEYNKLIRQGYQTSFAPVLNFVRKEIKKQVDETEAILDTTNGGKKGESALRLFMKVQDGMTLKAFQCSAYMLKPRKGIKRYTPKDYANKGKNPVTGGSRMTEDVTRMRGMDDEDDDDDELDEPQPVVRKKLTSKRGRGHKQQ
ncbi:hypothetical protein D1007_34820 [Hordeum vulgare]|nr:hypothetical protein D1007_34820 [Hordeum vulgare]